MLYTKARRRGATIDAARRLPQLIAEAELRVVNAHGRFRLLANAREPIEATLTALQSARSAVVEHGVATDVERLVQHHVVGADLVAVANTLTVIARHLSAAMAYLGDRRQGLVYAEQALAVAERVRFRPEVAVARSQLAELGVVGAQAYAEQAVSEFRAMHIAVR